MNVAIRPRAKADIDQITAYLDEHSDVAAARFLKGLSLTFELLERFSAAGTRVTVRRRRTARLRRFGVRDFDHYVVYYREGNGVEVIRILHTARNRDAILEDEF